MHEYMYVCMHVCIVCVYTCVHVSMCICMYVYMYACVYTCMYIRNFHVGFEPEGELSRGEMSGPRALTQALSGISLVVVYGENLVAGWGMLHRLRGWTPLGITIILKMDTH